MPRSVTSSLTKLRPEPTLSDTKSTVLNPVLYCLTISSYLVFSLHGKTCLSCLKILPRSPNIAKTRIWQKAKLLRIGLRPHKATECYYSLRKSSRTIHKEASLLRFSAVWITQEQRTFIFTFSSLYSVGVTVLKRILSFSCSSSGTRGEVPRGLSLPVWPSLDTRSLTQAGTELGFVITRHHHGRKKKPLNGNDFVRTRSVTVGAASRWLVLGFLLRQRPV